jgi:hypothetical protein
MRKELILKESPKNFQALSRGSKAASGRRKTKAAKSLARGEESPAQGAKA